MTALQDNMETSGQVIKFDVLFDWNLYKSNKITRTKTGEKKYPLLLKVHLIDPVTGMHMIDEDRINMAIKREGEILSSESEPATENKEESNNVIKRKDIYEIFASKYFDTEQISKAALDMAIDDLSKKLYSKHENTILRKKNETPDIGNLNTNQIYLRYQKAYFKTLPTLAKSTLDRKRTVLMQACEFLMDVPVVNIKKGKIKKLFETRKFRINKNLIKDFLSFARNKNAYTGANPIEEYLDNNHLLKKQKGENFYPKTLEYIPIENELILHDLIIKNISDAEIMAIILPKCFGVSLSDAMELTWDSFEIIDDVVYYIDVANRDTLSARDWTHPALGEGAFFIRLLVKNMTEKYGEKEIWNNKKVIQIREHRIDVNGKKRATKTARLTGYVRNMLKAAGLTDIEISSASPGDKNAGGAGVTLLKKHYRYVLVERCGLSEDSAEFKFLMHLNPSSVMDKHYRSMSDKVSGLPFYEVIARRDNFFEKDKPESEKEYTEEIDDDGVTYEIPSQGPRYKTCVRVKKVFIPKGTLIVCASVYGHSGMVSFASSVDAELGRGKDIY